MTSAIHKPKNQSLSKYGNEKCGLTDGRNLPIMRSLIYSLRIA